MRSRPTSLLMRVLCTLAVVASVAACSGHQASIDGAAGSTREVTHEFGTVVVPAQPLRLVATDEYAAMSALTLGIEPIRVYGSFGSEISAEILAGAGVPVTPALTFFSETPTEEIATLGPDMILMTGGAELQELHDTLSAIAPVVALPYYGATWQEAVTASGTAFGRADRAGAIVAGLERRLADVAAGADPTSVSVIGETYGECCFSAARGTPLSSVLREAGFTRPAAQDVESSVGGREIVVVSPERLGEHDADLVVVPQGAFYDAGRVRALPTFQTLPAALDGRTLQVDGDMWFGNFAFAVDWVITDLATIAPGGGQDRIGTPADALDRWQEFLDRLPTETPR